MAQKKTKKSNNYWKNRFLKLEEASNRYGQDAFREIEPAFDSAQRQIQNEIEKWYYRFAKNNQITIEEAKKMLSAKELKEFHWDVEEYIKYGRENAINQQWMKELENASARVHVSRLEALKVRTQQAAEVAFGNELDVIDKMARKVYTEDYYRTIFEMQKGFNIGWDIGTIDQKKLDKLIVKPWTTDNKTFKDRIWNSKSQMISELHQQITRTCVLGKAPDEAIESLTKYVDKDIKNKKYVAGRLVMTEQAYFHSAAQKDAFAELDVEKVEIVATLDSHTSTICQDMDGQIVEMKDYEPGVTVPPFHVFCRSVTVPYFDDNFDVGERAARDEDGNTYYVPDDMTYKDWKKSFVDGDSKDGIAPVVDIAKNAPHEWDVNKRIAELEEELMNPDTPFDRWVEIEEEIEELKAKEAEMYKIKMKENKQLRIQSASDSINASGVFEKEVDLTGCDVKCAESITKATQKVSEDFTDLRLKSLRISKSNMKGSKVVNADSLGKTTNKSMVFSGTYFDDHDNLSKILQNQFNQGKLSTKTVEGLVFHEYGHAICDAYKVDVKDIVNEIMRKNGFDVRKGMSKSKYDELFHISDYGDTDLDEWFAECYADYMDSMTPKEISIEAVEIFKKIISRKTT